MKRNLPALVAAGLAMAQSSLPTTRGDAGTRAIVIAHRGASGERPEHTLEAYRLAIEQGAEFVEPDLVATRDGVLVCRHENEISGTTDVASRPEFADRRTTKSIDGVTVTGWFTEDFTLAELKTLRARERLPHLRGTAFDGRYEVPTFDEVLDLVSTHDASAGRSGRRVGVYPETKHPTYFQHLGTPLEGPLLDALRRRGLDAAGAPVFIQSFEVENLRGLAARTRVPLIQLIEAEGRPWESTPTPSSPTYAEMTRPEGLREIATYARGIGVHKSLVIRRDDGGRSGSSTTLVRDAHTAGLVVHVWTLRAENQFLPAERRRGTDPAAHGDLAGEVRQFLEAGVDGVFSDFPATAVGARDAGEL